MGSRRGAVNVLLLFGISNQSLELFILVEILAAEQRERAHEEETDDGSAADASADAGSQTDADKATAAPASPKQEPSAKSPKVENIE